MTSIKIGISLCREELNELMRDKGIKKKEIGEENEEKKENGHDEI